MYQPISVNVKSGFFFPSIFFSLLLVFKIISLFPSRSLVFSVLHTDVRSLFPLSPHICIRIMAEFRKIQHNAELMVAPFLIHTGYKILASHKKNILTMCVSSLYCFGFGACPTCIKPEVLDTFTAIARANKQQITCTMYDLKHGGKPKHCQKVTPYSPLWLRVQTEAGVSGTKNTDLI